MRDDSLYRWLRDELEAGESVDLETIGEEFEEGARPFARRTLERFEEEGVVTERPGEGYVAADVDAVRAAFDDLLESSDDEEDDAEASASSEPRTVESRSTTEPAITRPAEVDRDHSVDTVASKDAIVVSIPSGLRDEFAAEVENPQDKRVLSLREALEEVLRTAQETVRLCVPFLEKDGINLLQSEFDGLAEDDVDVKILTRGVYDPMGYESGKARDLNALYQLSERYKARTEYGVVGIRDFQNVMRTKSGSGKTEEKLESSVHLKAVIADGTLAYVGSGEVRDSSMYTNLEGGMLTSDEDVVGYWCDVFDFFYERGERVRADHFESSIS